MEPGRPYFKAHLVRHGLPQNTVMGITHDARGVLWVATQDGAASFDGTQWSTVDMPERQVSNFVECVFPSADGSVWFGRQDGGISRRNRDGTWTTFGAESLPATRVTCLAEAPGPDGRMVLWAGTYGGGLARYSDGRWTLPEGRKGWPFPRLWKLVPSRDPAHRGSLWVCGEGGTLVRLDSSGASQAYPGLPKVSINHLLESWDEQGRLELWASTFGAGIARYREGSWTFLTARDGLPSHFTTDVAETRTPSGARVLWFASVGGLSRLEAGRLRTFTARSGLGTDTIYRLCRDSQREDALWVGTHGGGLLQYREGGWRIHDLFSGLQGNFVLSLAEGGTAERPVVLAGTSLGISRFQGGRWQDVPFPAGQASTRINALVESRRGERSTLWAGTLAGLLRWEGGRWTTFGKAAGLPSLAIGVLLEGHDDQGREVLWVGTQNGGLAYWDGARFHPVPIGRGESSDNLLSLAESLDPDGKWSLWAGFRNGGLGQRKEGRWTFWTREHGLPNNSVSALLLSRSPAGRPRILAGTLGGGMAWAWLDTPQPQWRQVASKDHPALPNDTIQSLVEDHRGRVFLGTNRGVCRLTPEGEEEWSFHTYQERDGLPGLQCAPNGTLLGRDGRLWVGTTLGLAELEVQQDPPAPLVGKLIVSEVRAGGKLIPDFPWKKVTLQHPVRDVDLEFRLLDYHGSSLPSYRTRLEGPEQGSTSWEPVGRRSLTNLPHGTYLLRIWARDDLGREIGPLSWPFEVLPAPWETLWFRGTLVVVMALAVFLGIRLRLKAAHDRAAQLELLVSQRTEDLARSNSRLVQEIKERTAAEKVKDEFVSVVSHELRTPLTSIRGALGLMDGGVVQGLGGQAAELIRIAHANALRLMALVNDLLDIQRLESDQVHLQLETLDLRALVRRMVEAHEGLAQTFSTAFRFPDAKEPLPVRADARRIEQVLGNLLANAAKFSQRDSVVEIEAAPGEGMARVAVTNHGPPIPEEFRGRIFRRFAQADASSSRPAGGTGLGLAISKLLVEAHGGRIGFTSDEAATTFWFELPLADPKSATA